jgi:glycosyltransferase involved in cell wall biosynthesis
MKISIIIPAYNEEEGIGSVISQIPTRKLLNSGYQYEIIVIDNGSTDRTALIAKELGATVINEPKKGKGNALRTGFSFVSKDTDYIVMLDADDTYNLGEMLHLIEPLDSGFCSVVIGSRLNGNIKDGSMSTFNRFGNLFFSYLVRIFYKVNVTDTLTGYFAFKREVVENLYPQLTSNGFAIEMEMITKMARMGQKIYSVPISYHARAGESNLRPIHDGTIIMYMFIRNLFWHSNVPRLKQLKPETVTIHKQDF